MIKAGFRRPDASPVTRPTTTTYGQFSRRTVFIQGSENKKGYLITTNTIERHHNIRRYKLSMSGSSI